MTGGPVESNFCICPGCNIIRAEDILRKWLVISTGNLPEKGCINEVIR